MDKRVVRPSVEHEVDEEFAHHVEMRVRDLVARGWTEEDARREAIRRFGDIDRLKSDCREQGTRRDVEMHRRQWWDEIRQDLRYAFRQLRRSPSFALITIVTLAIAIGANSAVFSVVDAVILAPLPYPEPDRISMVWTRYLPPSGFDIDKFALSPTEALDIREQSEALESFGIFTTGSRALTGDGEDAERVRVGLYSSEMLSVLGVSPMLGRGFSPEEDVADGPAVTILSYELWNDRFGADSTIVGRTILMNGVPTQVVGVMGEGYEFPAGIRAYLPIGIDRTNQGGRASHYVVGVGRRAPGISQADLGAELAVIADRWASEYEHNVAHFPWSQPLHTEVVADAPRTLTLLMSAVALVLLVACANVANLLLARGERRQTEVAVRRTLGAGRGRITRQLATESLVLASISAIVGLGLAGIGLKTLVSMDADALPRLQQAHLGTPVLLFTLGTTAVTALLFGIIPASLAGRRTASTVATSSSRAIGGRRGSQVRRVLVTGEVALSLVVVILAGLVVRSFEALTGTDPRMDPTNLITFQISLPSSSYPTDEQVPAEFERMLDQLRALPGVSAASGVTSLPFTGRSQWDFEIDGRPPRQEGEVARNAGINWVASDYFETMGIPVLRGRTMGPRDTGDTEPVAVVSQAMASRYWPGEEVLGKRFRYQDDHWITIVGVVPDPVTTTLDAEAYPHVYLPEAQGEAATNNTPRSLQIAVRSEVGAEATLPAIRSAIREFDADLPLYQVSTMEDIVDDTLAGPRVTTNLLGTFATIALLLAAVGIYGVISYSVAGRTREIGVRVALGAERREITRLILSEGARPVVVGVILGLGVAWFSTRLVESMLYGVAPTDPVTFVSLPLLLLGVGVVASLAPALRATRIPPTEALRQG